MLCHHNKKLHTVLPLHIRFLDARRHDRVSGLVSLAEFRRLNPDISIANLCQAGFRMANWGYCPDKHSRKWRCPVAAGKKEKCTCEVPCSSSPYGRCVYTKPDWDIRLYSPVPRGTEEHRIIYGNRTGSERLNNRILNNYHLHDMRIHTKKRYSFFAMIAGINIHLDARIKQLKLASAA